LREVCIRIRKDLRKLTNALRGPERYSDRNQSTLRLFRSWIETSKALRDKLRESRRTKMRANLRPRQKRITP
jgi:hypothetical protein